MEKVIFITSMDFIGYELGDIVEMKKDDDSEDTYIYTYKDSDGRRHDRKFVLGEDIWLLSVISEVGAENFFKFAIARRLEQIEDLRVNAIERINTKYDTKQQYVTKLPERLQELIKENE